MTLFFLLPHSELMHCGNTSQCSPPAACGESMQEDGSSGSQGFGFTGTGLLADLISLHLLPKSGQPDPGAEVVGGRGRPHLKEQSVLKK